MKSIYFFIFLLSIYSCNQKPKHPQTGLINQRTAAPMTEKDILQYTDSLDANINGLAKQTSMVYQLSDRLMYVEQYSWKGDPVMFMEYLNNEGLSSQTRIYYLKNDSLVLMKDKILPARSNSHKQTENRAYIRNNIIFKSEGRVSAIEKVAENLLQVKDALHASNKFDLLFEDILPDGEENRILLKSKLPDGYHATVLVTQRDALIDSLIRMPAVFKDKKINMKWQVADHEAVYVPVAESMTSASGLNR